MNFNKKEDAEAFGHSIDATHLVHHGNGNYQFLMELHKKIPLNWKSKIFVDAVFNEKYMGWHPWDNVEYCGMVAMCSNAEKLELRIV